MSNCRNNSVGLRNSGFEPDLVLEEHQFDYDRILDFLEEGRIDDAFLLENQVDHEGGCMDVSCPPLEDHSGDEVNFINLDAARFYG